MKHIHDKTTYTLEQLNQLWGELENVYFDDNEELEQSWHHFDKGTDKYTIWYWFEDQHADFSVANMLGLVNKS